MYEGNIFFFSNEREKYNILVLERQFRFRFRATESCYGERKGCASRYHLLIFRFFYQLLSLSSRLLAIWSVKSSCAVVSPKSYE